ncbi:MAG: DUF3526 domain-containing protein [Pseudomonadota bacterium]
MNLSAVRRESRFLVRDRSFIVWVGVSLLLATLAVTGGMAEVQQQRQTIAELLHSDRADREEALADQSTWGGVAYYAFHLTYDPPSDFAFAAIGGRDQEPWKHRIRMLALEGQLYERDGGNPALALTGRFDFAFLLAYIIPLILIFLLHDLQSGERGAGRHTLLSATAGRAGSPWRVRALIRVSVLAVAVAAPLVVASLASGAKAGTVAVALLVLIAYIVFWALLCYYLAKIDLSSSAILARLLGIWVLLAVVTPAASKLAIDAAVPIPSGADIVMTQREAVNDAWDLPKETTMEAFVARYPEWGDYTEVTRPFEWKWYYAFQQVGDQATEALAAAYQAGRQRRDYLTAILVWLSPPALLERVYQRLANTDALARLRYEASVRDFHERLRLFYYPKLFRDEPFDSQLLNELPFYLTSEDGQ